MIMIGITGTLGAGKGTIVDCLKERGFSHFSARDFLVKEIEKRGLPINRDSMTSTANAIRREYGNDYIIRSMMDQALKEGKNCVIESVRNPEEVLLMRKVSGFYLFSVDADLKIRYERIKLRKSETDNVDFETFVANEQREMNPQNGKSQDIGSCMAMADYRFENNSDIAALRERVNAVISEIERKTRPSWDEYFMELADAASKRATCDRGRSGCVIVKDRQVLVTGYVGSPTGLAHCDDVGHLLKQTINEDGSISTHCVRTVHAEQNAICQAAKRGIALEGATLYCRMTPCRTCAMMIINCEIKRVVCQMKYHAGAESEKMFSEAGIELVFFDNSILKYDKQ